MYIYIYVYAARAVVRVKVISLIVRVYVYICVRVHIRLKYDESRLRGSFVSVYIETTCTRRCKTIWTSKANFTVLYRETLKCR